MKTPNKSLESIFPLMCIKDGVIVSKRGDLTVGWEVSLPCCYSMIEPQYDELISSFSSAIGVLDPWMMVHRQDIYTYDKYQGQKRGHFLADSYENHFDGRRYLTHKQYLFLTLTDKAAATKGVSSSGILSLISPERKDLSKELGRLMTKASEFASVLTGKGMVSLQRMDDTQLMTALSCYMSLEEKDGIVSDIEMTPESVRINDRNMWAYIINEAKALPSVIESSSRVDALSGPSSSLFLSKGAAIGPLLPCEHMVNSYIMTIPQADTINEIDARRKRMLSMSRNAENKNNSEELESFLEQSHREKLITVRSHTNIFVWGSKDDKLSLRGTISSALSSMGIACVQDIYDTPVLWYSAIPGAACEIGIENLMLTELESGLCLGVYDTYEREIPGGLMKMCDRMRNVPIRIDVQSAAYNAGLIDNYNAFILGGSGTGKSFFTNYFVRSCYDAGETVFIIDVGDSYEGLCSIIREESEGKDGIYHTWDREKPISFDAFLGFEDWVDSQGVLRQDSDGLNFLLSFLQTLWAPQGGWDASSSNILKEIIRDFCNERKKTGIHPIFNDFRNFILNDITPKMKSRKGYMCGEINVNITRFDIVGLVLAMGDYSKGGAFEFLLNDPAPKDLFSSRFTVFEVEKLSSINDSKFYSLCILCIMNAFNAKMKSTEGFKVMVIEEAWKAIANETMGPYLAGLWKTARKYQTSAVVVTQQVSDIISSGVIRDTILQNSSVRILLDQSNNQNNFEQLRTLLGLSAHQKDIIMSMNRANNPDYKYREVFIALGDKKCGVYATEVSPEEAVAYESNKEKKRPFIDKSAICGPIGAIKEIVNNNK